MNNSKKNKKLLIEQLVFLAEGVSAPFTKEEIVDKTKRLSERDLELLILMYQEEAAHQSGLDQLARVVDPEGFREVEQKHQKSIQKIDEDYYKKIKEIMLNAAEKLDDLERNSTEENKRIVEEMDKELDGLEEERENLLVQVYSALQDKLGTRSAST